MTWPAPEIETGKDLEKFSVAFLKDYFLKVNA